MACTQNYGIDKREQENMCGIGKAKRNLVKVYFPLLLFCTSSININMRKYKNITWKYYKYAQSIEVPPFFYHLNHYTNNKTFLLSFFCIPSSFLISYNTTYTQSFSTSHRKVTLNQIFIEFHFFSCHAPICKRVKGRKVDVTNVIINKSTCDERSRICESIEYLQIDSVIVIFPNCFVSV